MIFVKYILVGRIGAQSLHNNAFCKKKHDILTDATITEMNAESQKNLTFKISSIN